MKSISKQTVLHISLPIAVSIIFGIITAVGLYYTFDNRIENNKTGFNHISTWINEHEDIQKDTIKRIVNLEKLNSKITTDLQRIKTTLIKIENKL